MAGLKIRRIDGSTESRTLSRSQPLTIGRQQFNDICVLEHDVAPLHCRISWNKTGFEVTAATSDGVEVNSSTVAHATLKPGDTIRVGTAHLVFDDEVSIAKVEPAVERTEVRKSKIKKEPIPKPAEELSSFEGVVETESQAVLNALFDENEQLAEETSPPKVPVQGGKHYSSGQARPGEQEILKSPLVLTLAGGGLALALITGIFWFLIGREQSNRLYDRAVQEMNDGQYTQSITTFERFIATYPNHGLRRNADRGLAKASIQKEISGATPSWKRGLERLNELIKVHRNESDFADLHSAIFQYADQISLGAAKSAESTHDAELLVISKDAQNILERYSDPSAPPTGTVGRIKDQRAKAERAIAKQSTFDLAMKSVDSAIADRKPMLALSERERLVKEFPDFIGSKRVKDSLQKSLDLERSVVATDETERPAETTDDPPLRFEPGLGNIAFEVAI